MIVASSHVAQTATLPKSLTIDGTSVTFAPFVKNLGVTIQSDLSLERHVINTCRSSYSEIHRIASIRHLLTQESANTLVCSFVLSRLDYANSLLAGSTKTLKDRLQIVQNDAARLIVKVRRSEHVTPILHKLHWLPVQSRIQHKFLSVCHLSLTESGPPYLNELIHWYVPNRSLRSASDTKTLKRPPDSIRTKTHGERSFVFQGPTLWNQLPKPLRYTESHASFKRSLKTHLFKLNN